MGVKKEKWHQAIEHRFNKTGIALQKIIGDFSAEPIHDFRVEIKKLKALIRLASYMIADPSDCPFPKPLNKLYKALGSLREWQIQKANIVRAASEQQVTLPITYIHKIERKTETARRRVMGLMKGLPPVKKMMGKIKSCAPGELSPASIIRFIQSKLHAVYLVLESGITDDESMHGIRKNIKDVQYVLSEEAKSGETEEQSPPFVSVQEVSGLLGDYHDLCVALVMLKRELQIIRKETDEKKLLRKIKDGWQAEKIILLERTKQATQNLISLHFAGARQH